jgi:hypothetical protein
MGIRVLCLGLDGADYVKGEETDVRDLLHVLHERARGGRKITEIGGAPRRAQIRMRRENGASGRGAGSASLARVSLP